MRTLRIPSALAAALVLAGCGSSGSSTGPNDPGTQTGRAGIYVTNADNSVAVFNLTASGDVAPSRRIAGAATGLSLPIGIAVDSKGSVYVANRTGGRITVYGATDSGNVAPTRQLTDTAMLSPQGLVVGPSDDIFAVTCPNCGSAAGGATGMYHFPNGASAIDYFLRGANTGMTTPIGVGRDASGNVYIGNAFGGSVNVYAPGASGNSLPIRSFNPGASFNVQSLTVAGNTIALGAPGTGVLFYPTTASASAPPASTFAAGASLPLAYPGGVYVDTSVPQPVVYLVDYAGNAIYVIQTSGAAPNLLLQSVTTIKGANTRLSQPLSLTVVR